MPEREERRFPLPGPDQIAPERFMAPDLPMGALNRRVRYVGGKESQPFCHTGPHRTPSCYDMAVHALA